MGSGVQTDFSISEPPGYLNTTVTNGLFFLRHSFIPHHSFQEKNPSPRSGGGKTSWKHSLGDQIPDSHRSPGPPFPLVSSVLSLCRWEEDRV